MSKPKPTLDIVFDHGILESFLYKNPNKEIDTEYINILSDETIEEIETVYWERNPITFSKFLPSILNRTGSGFSINEMFNCVDIYIKSGDAKYVYKFRKNNII